MPTVLLQAGHDGGVRNSGTAGSKPSLGATGLTRPEREMTPIVRDAAAAELAKYDITVITEDAFYDKKYEVDLAISLHFDGSGTPCASGASVGYPSGSPAGSNKPTAQLWKEIYGEVWPFKWMPDNFTTALSGYYGYGWTSTTVAEMLIEFGEISCPEQNEWLDARLELLGSYVAYFVSEVFTLGMPEPGTEEPFGVYRTVTNCPTSGGKVKDWAKKVIDWGIEVGMINIEDDNVEDWTRTLTDGRYWTFEWRRRNG